MKLLEAAWITITIKYSENVECTLTEAFGNFEMHIFYPPAKDVFKVPSNNSSNSNCSSLAILYIENNKTYAEESPWGKSFEEDSEKDC
ncbi:hypothetical protein T01_5237 [Trichinella spiralis]|uniref:Uncharacterized protein n=1 Tax=Trichinella spiralis TaxID=6334 RepID=A0A0V1C1B0_TRISP|nr:hypothetical protein T01_5237 [Trichinella spiralis]